MDSFEKDSFMLIMLSPAKTMDMSSESVSGFPAGTEPVFAADARKLAAAMRRFSEAELAKMLKISPALAAQNYERYRLFGRPSNSRKEAIAAYNGSVFKAIGAATLTADDLLYAQDRIRIVSTLYGLVRPLDRIEAYRIAFSLKLFPEQGNLYDYWLPKLTGPLIADVRKAGGILVNLASLDIQGALRMDEVRRAVRVVTPEFQELRDGRYETVRTYAKICRGVMTRHIIQQRIESADELVKFMWNGFAFNPEVSDGERYVFTRERRP